MAGSETGYRGAGRQGRFGTIFFSGVLLALVCCSETHGPEKTVRPIEDPSAVQGEITVWAWNIAAKGLREVLPDFNKQYPNVKVDINMTGGQMLQRLLTSLAAGVGAPDVAQLETRYLERYTITGRLMDLTPVILPYKDDFVDSKWPPCIHEGRIYAVPWDLGPALVFYRRDVLENAGIDPTELTTWEKFIEAGKRLVRKTDGAVKMVHFYPPEPLDQLTLLTRQLGGGFFDAEGRITVHHPPVRRATDALRRMVEAGITYEVRPNYHEWLASFNEGTVACHLSGVWLGGTLRDIAKDTAGLWGVMRLPAFELDDGTLSGTASNLGGSTLAITNQCKNPQAAWAFLKTTMCTKQAQMTQYRTFDLFPALKTVYHDPFFDEPDEFFAGQRMRRLAAQVAQEVPTFHFTSDWREVLYFVNMGLLDVFEGRKSVEQGLNDLADTLHRKLSRPLAPVPDQETETKEAA